MFRLPETIDVPLPTSALIGLSVCVRVISRPFSPLDMFHDHATDCSVS
ncbi:hypothetical protein AtDm6_0789 [Acetobacter tropicalis]|uniref:Uncharacterized protein n=1 Tax=Acetobacter tropicalis TaxID=104102 RepID=A0A095B8K2_9PROT|nr:hypothetical protein AtDm6_0789 [Acetobacter tropicalis]